MPRLFGAGAASPDSLRAPASDAARIIAAYYVRGGFPTVMTSPPTVAQSTTGNSTLNATTWQLPAILLNDPAIRSQGPIAPVRTDDTSTLKHGYAAATTSRSGGVYTGGNGWEIAFNTTGLSAFELVMSGFAASSSYTIRVFVDGQAVTSGDEAIDSSTFAFYGGHRKYTFSGAASRKIRVVCSKDCAIIGINLNSGATIALPVAPADEVNLVTFGDSYVDTGGTATIPSQGTFSARLALLMGLRYTPMGRSGQGYVLAVDGLTINQRVSLDGPRIPTPDMVLLYGSVNDNAQDPAVAQPNMANAVSSARALWPYAWIVVLSSFSSTGAPINSTRNAAFYNGATSVADSRTMVIDTNLIPLAIAQTTGTLPNGAAHDSPEGVHTGPNEIAYNDGLILQHIIARLQGTLLIYGVAAGGTANVAYGGFAPTVVNAVGTVTYALSGATLPAGLSFSTSTGAITGTPTAAGTTSGFVITATDGTTGKTSATAPFSLVIAAGAALTTFDPANTPGTITLSNSNRTASSSTNNVNTRSTTSRSSGLLYFEVARTGSSSGVGVGTAAASSNAFGGSSSNETVLDIASGNGFSGGTSQGSAGLGTIAGTDTIGCAVNFTSGKIWFSKNGTFGSGQVPASATGGFPILGGSMFIFSHPSTGSAGSMTVRTETSQLSYTPPSGFSPWN